MRIYPANNLQELAETITDLHRELAESPNGFVKPVLTIVNSDSNPVYKLIVTER